MQPLNLSLIQSATHWHDPASNRAMFEDCFARVPNDADLIVLPEMFSTGFTMASSDVAEPMSGPTVAWLGEQARALGRVLCGSLVIEHGGEYFNRFVWVPPDGEMRCYDKRHRFRMAGEHEHYSAGGTHIVVELNGWRICPMVCYDLRFPVWFRNRGDYDALLCVANWPAARREVWNTLLRARAIENQVYAAGVNIVGVDGAGVSYSGGSAVYAPDGEVLAELPDEAGIINCAFDADRLQSLRESFPVGDDADQFELVE